MNRRTSLRLLGLTALAGPLAACGAEAAAGGSELKQLKYQGSVGAVTLPELAADLGLLGDLTLQWVGNTISGPQDIQAATTGDTHFGGAFNGAVIKLAAAGAPIKSVISYYGTDESTFIGYYVLDGGPVRTARDLIGKKVGMNTLGAHAEAVLKTYLKRGGLSDDEIRQVELLALPPVNTEQALRAGQIDVAALGGILRDKALERGGVRKLFSDYDLIGAFNAGTYVFRKDVLAKNPTTVRTFVEGVAQAIEWTKQHPREEVVARFTDIIGRRGRTEDASALKFWKSFGISAKGGVIAERDFQTWLDWLNLTGELKGKQVKVADVYTNEYNPFRDGAR
ncbi:ABC transporter substrate-binding protein [Catellatospora sp. TT07R-123]|uniref:ABC transporter substrate-binding protein n=1 Tax=Catellatospora sp. TT07R-123 TaxID=2733863 RepID=UPI001B132A53|nr:ABC transporter substrate-binding protein [Catellatospora sp. TT07R-123]GHJ43644.1 ABC transporter substrate-binding protein [Catellatospora sp. TT07R-123]